MIYSLSEYVVYLQITIKKKVDFPYNLLTRIFNLISNVN